MAAKELKNITRMIRALSDENRVRIICLLDVEKELCVCEITRIIGLAQPTISSHLRLLENAGLVQSRKDGLWVNYSLIKGRNSCSCQVVKVLTASLKRDKQINSDLGRIGHSRKEEICCRKDSTLA